MKNCVLNETCKDESESWLFSLDKCDTSKSRDDIMATLNADYLFFSLPPPPHHIHKKELYS